jgi:hypothetical protein
METRQCQAFVESKGRRCEKTIRWSKKYCWWHYPKAGPIWALILGAFLGFILTLLFNGPLMCSLSQITPFHYLDRNDPIIVRVVPDIRASHYIDADIRTFSVSCRDDCSGLDLACCRINLYYFKDNRLESLGGRTSAMANGFEFTIDNKLVHGEYLLRIFLFDKAENKCESEYSFTVPENDIFGITVNYEEYDENKHKQLISSVPDKLEGLIDMMDLFVYHIIVRNEAEKTYCRDVYLTLDVSGVVYSWEEEGGLDYTGTISLDISESFMKALPKNRIFGSQRTLSIDEIAPKGSVRFTALVGFMNIDNVHSDVNGPSEIGVFGNYVSEGYGKTKVENVRRWVPVRRFNSGN